MPDDLVTQIMKRLKGEIVDLLPMSNSDVRDGKDERHLADVLTRSTLKALNEKGLTEGRESRTFTFKDQGVQSINPQVQFQGTYIVRKDWVPTKTE